MGGPANRRHAFRRPLFFATVRADCCLTPPPPDHMLSSIFPNSPSGSTVWIGDSASSVHGTGSGKFVCNKRRPLPGKTFLLIGDGRKMKMECFGSLDVVFHRKDDVQVALENVAVVPGLTFDLMSFNCIQEKHDISITATVPGFLTAGCTLSSFQSETISRLLRWSMALILLQ